MRIIAESVAKEAAVKFPKAETYLAAWVTTVRAAAWTAFVDVRAVYPSADLVTVRSGRKVVIFNVCGNEYRFIVAIHFNRQTIYTLRFLTHADYSKGKWKDEL